jgi:hypothetical protein
MRLAILVAFVAAVALSLCCLAWCQSRPLDTWLTNGVYRAAFPPGR